MTTDLAQKQQTGTKGPAMTLQVNDKAIATITINNPDGKVNLLGSSGMTELNALVDKVIADKAIKGLIFASGKDDNFIAGADVSEIRALQHQNEMQCYAAAQAGKEVYSKIDKLPFPVVAAINGTCLGGGTELALACDFRIASEKAKVGLPEVMLGFVPGWGGCYRMPKLIGLQKALELIMSGKVLDAKRAWRAGLVDEVVEPSRLLSRAAEVAGGDRPRKNVPDLKETAMRIALEANPLGLSVLRSQAYKTMMRQTKGKYPAPKEALSVVLKAAKLPEKKAFELESTTFARLAVTSVSKNLVDIFFWQQDSKKLPSGTTQKPNVKTVAVMGAGVMGAGIAQAAAKAGYKVVVKDIEQKFLDNGKKTITELFGKLVERKKLKQDEVDKIVSDIVFTTSYDDLSDCDLVIEAILEDLKVKQDALAELDKRINKKYVFATNTSSLSVDKIAEGTADPSKVVGLHFFNPVHKMPLVEVVRGAKSSNDALAAAMSVALKMNRTPTDALVITKDSPGFVVNRILAPYLREAAVLAEEGTPIEDIDKAMKNFGMPMGPLVLLDEIGLDIAGKVIHVMHDALGERMTPPKLMEDIDKLKVYGRKKGGKGIYLYDEKGKPSTVNPDVQACITAQPNKKTPGDIQDRLVLLMLNEAARCMEEKVVDKPSQLDLAMVFGTGFPPFLGGLLKYADSLGLDIVHEKLDLLSRVAGPRYAPCELIKTMASNRQAFYGNKSAAN